MLLAAWSMFAIGCQPFNSNVPNVVYPAPAWHVPQTVQQPQAAPNSNTLASAPVVRGQSPGYGGYNVGALPPSTPSPYPVNDGSVGQPAAAYNQGGAAPYTVFQAPGTGLNQPGVAVGPITTGGPTVLPVHQPPFVPDSSLVLPPDRPIDLDVMLQEAQTGRIMFGVGVNSDAGLIGNLVIDEQNFDIMRWPTGLDDWLNGTAFRGAGQRFRLEALPGTQVQRYSASFSEPYLFGTTVSLGLSAFYYERQFTDWEERRWGGRTSFGYIFPERPDLSTTFSVRYEQIDIARPRVLGVPELAQVVGDNDLLSFRWDISHDTRDNAYLPSEGHLIRLSFEQAIGTFVYPKFEGDYRRYFVMSERPDRSGRHVLGVAAKLGVSGADTPLYEHFFAGGFSTIRGFDFRGASPKTGTVVVGGEFQMLASAE